MVDVLNVCWQKLFDMLASMVTINSMAITNAEEPVILNLTEAFDYKVIVLIRFRRFVRNKATSRFERIFKNYVLNPTVSNLVIIVKNRLLIASSSTFEDSVMKLMLARVRCYILRHLILSSNGFDRASLDITV